MGATKFTAAWQRFLSAVLKDHPEEQQERARLVFYASGSVVFDLLTEGLDNMTIEEAHRVINELGEEFSSFQSELILPTPIEH